MCVRARACVRACVCVCVCVINIHISNVQVLEQCKLGNILSLWETISVELSKQLTLGGQVSLHVE